MPVREQEFYHGIALLRAIASCDDAIKIGRRDDVGSGCYAVAGIGIQVKYATDRLSPWQFSFTAEHRRAQDALIDEYGSCGIVLVCHQNCVVVLSQHDIDDVLGESPAAGTIAVVRKPREMAQVRGPLSTLPYKLRDSDFGRLGAPFAT